MNGEDLIDSMEYVDAQWVEEAENPAPVKRKRWIPVVSVAACLAIVVGLLLIPHGVKPPKNDGSISLSAEQVAWLFNKGEIGGGTQSYEMAIVAKGQELKTRPLPTTETLTIYNRNDTTIELDKEALNQWGTPIMERMCDSLGIPVPEKWENRREHGYNIGYNRYPKDKYRYFFVERSWDAGYYSGQYELCLDGELICVNPNQSEEEILASLDSIKHKLFKIFGKDFSDAVVIRRTAFGHGEPDIEVYYYDKLAHPLNELLEKRPISDYIVLRFDRENIKNQAISEDQYVNVSILCCDYIIEPDAYYEAVGEAKLISLERAEELLNKGYVFGGIDCSECMAGQKEIDFSDYDYVSYQYKEDAVMGEVDIVVPFYTFYKKLEQWNDGHPRYAKTYVCAVEVSGLEQYFEKKAEEHHKE